MRFFNKYFFVGFLSGILFLIIVSVLGAYILLTMRPGDPAEEMGALLPSPVFPSSQQIAIHGQVNNEWTLRRLDGKLATLSEFKGKNIFVHFWATWCRPWCIAELPGIQKLYNSLKNEDVVFILVSEDKDEDMLRKFLKEKQYSFPVYLSEKEIPPLFQTVGVPATFIVGRDGSVLFRHIGPANWADGQTHVFLRGLR